MPAPPCEMQPLARCTRPARRGRSRVATIARRDYHRPAMSFRRFPRVAFFVALAGWLLTAAGCDYSAGRVDRDIAAAIAKRQQQALRYERPARVEANQAGDDRATSAAYDYAPSPSDTTIPAGFEAAAPATAQAAGEATAPASQPTSRQTRYRESPFTLTDALAYAQRHRREYQTAKEDLYLAALALSLERHLWTPQFAADLRTVYGNFGEIRNFDQAMRFMSDLSLAQRLPYGGEFTAKAVSTLIRDVVQSITAEESGSIELGLNIPFLRNAGHVAREELIQLERDLTYAVRDFERFRRRQLVEVAQAYFELLRQKQEVLDGLATRERFESDFERAQALEDAGTGSQLDTRRAEQETLSAANRVEDLFERFRAATDEFKLLIGMPVDENLGVEDLEGIESIEEQIVQGRYPILLKPPAADDEARATEVAVQFRLDLLNRKDQIDDARRGVAVAQNRLLPDLNWNSTLRFDTEADRKNVGAFNYERATWRSEIVLGLPLERFRERNQYRSALIDVNRARRNHQQALDRVRAEVRGAVNRLRLEEKALEIQQRNLEVSDLRREYARIQFYDGDIGNRDLIEAENDWTDARNRLNLAKTSRWQALLDFRLATETLRIDENGDAPASP